MDKIDNGLLFELNWNCRQTSTALGKKLRISKQVVNYRRKRLERKNIIQGYTALIDWRKLGYNSIRAYLKWRNLDPEKEAEIYDYIRKDPFFMWTAKIEVEFDVGCYMWVKQMPEFADKWFGFLKKYRKNILKEELYESVNMIIYPMKSLIKNAPAEEKIIGNGAAVKYDDIDYEILKIITKDAAIPAVKLAEKIKLTSKAAIYRLKQMEAKGIIVGYIALINPKQLGVDFYKIDFYLNDLSRIKEMIEFAKQHDKVWALMRTIGGPDYEIEVMVKNTNELNRLINEIRKKFADTIEHYRFHRFENIKQVYLPGDD